MGRARGANTAVAVRDKRFDAVMGSRRGDESKMASDGAWVGVLDAMRARGATDNVAVQRLAHSMAADVHASYRSAAMAMAARCGVGGTRAEHIVTYKGKTLHLVEEPVGDQEGPHPRALCGRKLDGFACRKARRGDWQRDHDDGFKRCSKCDRHAGDVAEAAELPETVTPLYPADQAVFEAVVDQQARELAATALADHKLTDDELAARLDHAYTRTLLDHAVRAAERKPARALRAAYAKNPDCYQLAQELERLTGYPGDLEELLDNVDWRTLFEPAVPTDRKGGSGYNTGIHGWEDYRERLREQLIPIAAGRAQAERSRQAQERLDTAKAELAAAEAAAAEAEQPWQPSDDERII